LSLSWTKEIDKEFNLDKSKGRCVTRNFKRTGQCY